MGITADILKYLETITNQSDVLSQTINPGCNSLQNNSHHSTLLFLHRKLRIDTNIIFKNVIDVFCFLILIFCANTSCLERRPAPAPSTVPPHWTRSRRHRTPGKPRQKKKKENLKPPLFISKLTSQNYKSTVLQPQQEW